MYINLYTRLLQVFYELDPESPHYWFVTNAATEMGHEREK